MAKTTKHPNQLTDREVIRDFITAGRATLTLVSRKTQKRFTYKIVQALELNGQPQKPERFSVSLLTGPDKYTMFGTLKGEPLSFIFRSVPYIPAVDSPSVKGFWWFWKSLTAADASPGILDQVEVWHEGSCGRCGRALTVPESIASGIGPECAQRMAVVGLLEQIM